MANKTLNFEDFKAEKIDRNQQKVIRGGDDTTPPIDGNKDPIKGGGGVLG